MSPFVYRLQQVYKLRERRKQAQEQRVRDAQAAVREVEQRIADKQAEIQALADHMRQAHYTMLALHDEFLYKLRQDLENLYREREAALRRLEEERALLIQAQKDLEALEHHKEQAREQWLEEEKQREMRQLDEIATQRYFRARQMLMEEEGEL